MSLMKQRRFAAKAVMVSVLSALCGYASAEQIGALPLQGRTVGPFTAGQVSPGSWAAADDRKLNASINGQGGWQTITYSTRYDEEIATGVAHTGGHSWRLSNWFHTGLVNPILSPQFASVGESGAVNGDGGALGGSAQSPHVVYEFWFRSASTQADPGSYVSTTISDAPGNRMTYFGMFDERPGDVDSGCLDTAAGCFHVDVVDVTAGNDAANDGDATFKDHYSDSLQRGVWYRARIDATFVDGAGDVITDTSVCPATCHAGNDQIHYQIFDGNGNSVYDVTIGSWEAAYFDGRYSNAVGTKVAADYIAFRVSANADDGSQQPFDRNSVANRPRGVYFDDMSVTPASGTGFSTSFDFDRYVEKTGTDAPDCSVKGTPCKTITYAVGQSNPYDSVLVGKGTFAENTVPSDNLVLNTPIAIEGAQVGADARTRDIGGGGDANETILVPALMDGGLTPDSLGDVSVVRIGSSGVSLDGLVIDGDNTGISSPGTLNGTNPDADSGILAIGQNSNVTVRNVIIRNVPGSGMLACMNDVCRGGGSSGDNLIQHNRFTNITNPSNWGIGIYAGDNFYAQISDNLMDQVRVGIETENNSNANPGTQTPTVLRNEIHATRTGLFHNLFYANGSTYTLADNHIIATPNAMQIGQWNGVQIESMQSDQTVIVTGNVIDAGLLVGSGRPRAGYTLNNWDSTLSSSTAIDGGSVSNVDAGVLVTDASNYTGPVNGALVKNVTFTNVSLGAIYVEDTNELAGSPSVTIGSGNVYSSVQYQLALAGASPHVSFSGITGVDSVLVRVAGSYFFGRLNAGPCNVTQCTTTNASLTAGIAAVQTGGTVFIEHGTFDEMGVVGTGKDGVRITAADPANPPTLTRLSGVPNQPVFVVRETTGAASKNIEIDHLILSVDKSFSAEGLLVSGFVDGMEIHDNTFTQVWSAPPAAPIYNRTNAIAINIDGDHNSLGLRRVDGSNISIHDNTIGGSTAPHATMFRAGIAMDAGVGSIVHNHSAGLNHDAIVRFSTIVSGGSNGVLIDDNTFTGGGLEFDSPNAGVGPIAITHNSITANVANATAAPDQSVLEADISVLRLIDNFQKLPVSVANNTFSGYSKGFRGALIEDFPNATFTDNSFTPLAGATDFVSLVVSNKAINQNPTASLPFPMTFTALRNTFNGSGVANAGRAVEFIDDNDANGTASFGAINFGDTLAANANSFDANHHFYFNLVDQNCDTHNTPCMFLAYDAVGSVANTQVRPFRGNVLAINNLFGGIAPRAMGALQQAQLNLQTNDINDDTNLGYVDYGFTGALVYRLQGLVGNVQATIATPINQHLTNTGATISENVVIHFAVSRAGGIASGDVLLEVDTGGGSYQTVTLTPCPGNSLCGTLGGPGGFAVGIGFDVQTALRSTFFVADTYTVAGDVQGVTTNTIYAADALSVNVQPASSPNVGLNLQGPQTAQAGPTPSPYTARLTDTGGMTNENVVVDFAISRSGGIGASDLTIQYFDGATYQTIPLTLCNGNTQLCAKFGPPAGFSIGAGYDVTTQLHATYAKSGVFTINANVDGVTSHTTYATSSLSVTVAPGAAASIAANSSTTIAGTAGAQAAPLPSVIVRDANGNPVSGVGVTFTTGVNSGTLSGSAQVTDSNGVATVGGWNLGTASTQTVSAAGTSGTLTGAPVVFTANVNAVFDLSVTMTDNRNYVQYGHTLDYVIVVANSGPSIASNAVSDVLPSELDISGASWVCFSHTANATCTASGTGDLSDTPTIPSGGSVTYVLSATVLNDSNPIDEIVTNQITVATSGDQDTSNNSATSTTQIVIFRDSFELGGNGAQSNEVPSGQLDDSGSLNLDATTAPQIENLPVTWIRAVDSSQREIFRIEALRSDAALYVRFVTTQASGDELRSDWTLLTAQNSALALAIVGHSGSKDAVLAISNGMLQIAIPTWATLPVMLYTAQ
jgi:uncharacterized repeat protein (TIGR01451 family)